MQMKILTVFLLMVGVAYGDSGSGSSGGGSGASQCTGTVKDELKKTVTSTEPQLKGKKFCRQLKKNDCLSYDVCTKSCPCTCDQLAPNSGSSSNSATNGDSGHDGSSGGKKAGAGGKKASAGSLECFKSEAVVLTEQYGPITMAQLAETHRDSRVLARNAQGQLEFAPVTYWIHAQKDVRAEFVRLQTESGRAVSMTDEHLIYQTDCSGGTGRAIFARNVQIGKCVYILNEAKELHESRVVSKSTEYSNGVYAPLTSAGSIVVDDVLASCYTNIENESIQKFMYNIIINVQEALSGVVPSSIYDTAFNRQNGAGLIDIPRIVVNFLQLSKYLVH